MIAITRYRVPAEEADSFAARAREILAALAECPGHCRGRLCRTVDDPTLWAMVTEWEGAGHYRRGLGRPEVRMAAIPLSALAIDEPGAYEIV